MTTANKLSILTERVIPDFIKNDYPEFTELVRGYFKYLEQQFGAYDAAANLISYRDLDYTVPEYLEQLRKEKAVNIPPSTAINLKFLIKKIREFYLSKGTEDSYKFLFRAVFDSDLSFFYPKKYILRTSDSTTVLDDAKLQDSNYWQEWSYVIFSEVEMSKYEDFIYKNIHPAGLKFFAEYKAAPTELVSGVSIFDSTGYPYLDDPTHWYYKKIFGETATGNDTTLGPVLEKFSGEVVLPVYIDTSYFTTNREDPEFAKFMGGTLKNIEEIPLRLLEAGEGQQNIAVFINGEKIHINNLNVVMNEVNLVASPNQYGQATVPSYTLVSGKAVVGMYQLTSDPTHGASSYITSINSEGQFAITVENSFTPTQTNVLVFVDKKKVPHTQVSVVGQAVRVSGVLSGKQSDVYFLSQPPKASQAIFMNTSFRTITITAAGNWNPRDMMVFVDGKAKIPFVDFYYQPNTREIYFSEIQPSNVTVEVIILNSIGKERLFFSIEKAIGKTNWLIETKSNVFPVPDTIFSGNYYGYVTSLNPVHWWHITETAGTVADDAIGAANGTISSSGLMYGTYDYLITSNQKPQHPKFNGTSDYITAHSAIASIAGGSYSMACWCKFSSLPGGSDSHALMVINKQSTDTSNGTNRIYTFVDSSGRIGATCGPTTDEGFVSPQVFTASDRIFVVFTYDATSNSLKLYLQGEEQTTYLGRGAIANGNFPFVFDYDVVGTDRFSIGQDYEGSTTTDYWDGYIGEVALWNRVLTSSEISKLYAEGAV